MSCNIGKVVNHGSSCLGHQVEKNDIIFTAYLYGVGMCMFVQLVV